MSSVLGLSVSERHVCAVSLRRGRVAWAGHAEYSRLEDLEEVVARVVAECPRAPRSARLVLERDVAQVRAVSPAPRLSRSQVRRFVALEVSRLFRNGHGPFVTDGVVVTTTGRNRILVAVAASGALVEAVVRGCDQAGLDLEALGPACDVLPRATVGLSDGIVVRPLGDRTQVIEHRLGRLWRSRLVPGNGRAATPLVEALAALGPQASLHAAAYAAAAGRPTLSLIPPTLRAATAGAMVRRARLLLAVTATLLVLAIGVFDVRLRSAERAAAELVQAATTRLERARRARADLVQVTAALEALRTASRRRSRLLPLLASLTTTLSDSVVVAALAVDDSATRVTLLAPVVPRALAEVERVPGLDRPRLEGVVTRQAVVVAGERRDWNRFTVRAFIRGAR